jgi:hypothetical protein
MARRRREHEGRDDQDAAAVDLVADSDDQMVSALYSNRCVIDARSL